ncbi:MAG: Alkaline phosphatase synthesis transcriptional regulatory protein PhoP [Candidatus Scalindua arabica]|uniref:Alkaline phosphatase synthesis transcriptional regulatory protein PhoP n=1 Tax=Candidatus Scalindua arabica TaxID=1127984 RepID=A0A941W021_9BACT|nr:Alkaline phosphatase synthesis transcriptional regulatory protein PhoP [Candidatus Scalindua arabica]
MISPKILIIDDDPDIVEAMRMPLEANGYKVITANCGKEGLKKAREEIPDLIMLDVMMETDTEGFHVAYELRSENHDSEYRNCRKIPILMLTAISQKKGMSFSPEKDEVFLPVDDFIEKPIQPKDLLKKVAELLVNKE